jgi:hypothetical protein
MSTCRGTHPWLGVLTTVRQVLLSCSHVFHLACIRSFERFAMKKTCPLCRKNDYQMRLFGEGRRAHLSLCATRIQAVWRGHRARKQYAVLQRAHPPRDPRLRAAFFARQISQLTDSAVDSSTAESNALLREIDASLQRSRAVMASMEAAATRAAIDWPLIAATVHSRGDPGPCPICLQELAGSAAPVVREHQARSLVLLSCSHVFHAQCLLSFEDFNVDEWRRSCPVCRAAYVKSAEPFCL